MKRRLIAILLLITVLPLGLLGWLLVRLGLGEQQRMRDALQQVLEGQLRDLEEVIRGVMDNQERGLLSLPDTIGLEREALRAFVRRTPAVSAVCVLDPRGELVHPPPAGPLSRQEMEFIVRAEQVWKDKALFLHSNAERPPTDPGSPGQPVAQGPSRAHGWYGWYHGNGLRLLLWQRLQDGRVVGVEIDTFRLLADLIDRFPAESAGRPDDKARAFALRDSKGEVLYRWGGYGPGDREQPIGRLSLDAPLASWELQAFAPASAWAKEDSGRWLLLSSLLQLLPLALVLAGLAFYLYRESNRALREAQERVSLVNNVSHELKTPLTNIRMYAELLQGAREPEDERAAKHLEVVVSESQRLSRLIENVLSFARQQRGTLKLHFGEGVVDEVVSRVLESFRPALLARGVRVLFSPGAGRKCRLDPDALEQILNNLFSNVEKYAGAGGEANVTTRQEGNRTFIIVADRGPGIPEKERERIFKPFVRLGSRVNEGVAGTGIGLTIARELARLHGGEIRLLPSGQGATFEVTLDTGPADRMAASGGSED